MVWLLEKKINGKWIITCLATPTNTSKKPERELLEMYPRSLDVRVRRYTPTKEIIK